MNIDAKTGAVIVGLVMLGVVGAGLAMSEGKDLPVAGNILSKGQNGFQGVL